MQPISLLEIHSTVLLIENNKTHDPDSILTENFKVFSALRVALLRIILLKKLLISIVQNIYFYYLIKFRIDQEYSINKEILITLIYNDLLTK